MNTDNRKVVLIGTGMVGMSYAYALLNQNACAVSYTHLTLPTIA